jgi:hypothetical protein
MAIILLVNVVLIDDRPADPATSCKLARLYSYCNVILVEIEQMPGIPEFNENCVEKFESELSILVESDDILILVSYELNIS